MQWIWGHVNTGHPGVLCAPSRWSVSRAAGVSMETNNTVCFLIHIWLQICCSCPIVISPISSVELSFCFSFLPPRPSAFIRCRRGPLSVFSLSVLIIRAFLFHICSGSTSVLAGLGSALGGKVWKGREFKKQRVVVTMMAVGVLRRLSVKNNKRTSVVKIRQFPLACLAIFKGVVVKWKAGGGGGQRFQYLISTS